MDSVGKFFDDNTLMDTIQDVIDQFTDDVTEKQYVNTPSRNYVRDAKAMARTPADIKELPNAYQFIVDMPEVKSSEVKVQLEDNNVLVVRGERRREKEKDDKEGVKYLRMERKVGKLMRKFVLPDNVNAESIKAVCQDGVVTITVEKVPPPKTKGPRTIEVQAA